MRKIIVLAFMTLDGVMQAPGGPQEDTDGGFEHGGWLVPHFDERLGAIMHEQLTMPRDLLLGRRTYEILASYWPARESEWPGINAASRPAAERGYCPMLSRAFKGALVGRLFLFGEDREQAPSQCLQV